MRLGYRAMVLFVFVVMAADVSRANAQVSSWGDVTVSAARLDYDLSGTGNTPGLAVRATRRLTSNVSLEFGGMFAKPNQQFGPSTLFMPEAQLRYRWDVGRVSPYVGGGMGTALIKSDFHSEWDPTYSVGSGAGVRLTERLGLTGEFRLRVHEWRGGATTSELSTGVTWQLPSF